MQSANTSRSASWMLFASVMTINGLFALIAIRGIIVVGSYDDPDSYEALLLVSPLFLVALVTDHIVLRRIGTDWQRDVGYLSSLVLLVLFPIPFVMVIHGLLTMT